MNRDPCKPITYCRYCGHLQRIDSKDAIGRDCKQNYCSVKERIYSDNSIKRGGYCTFYVKGEDAFEDKKKEMSKERRCRYCGEPKKDAYDGCCRVCREKLPLVREIRAMGRAFMNEK